MSWAMVRIQCCVERMFDVARKTALRCSMPSASPMADFGPGARGFGTEAMPLIMSLLRRLYEGYAS